MSAARNNLPLQVSSFIGRERELAEVEQLLSRARLVTLTGAGGCGKTSLALRTANEVVNTYADGVCWIELAPFADPTLVPQAIAQALDLAEQPNRSVAHALLDYLRDKEMLLVLDNCEHLIDACARLAETLLQQCPDLYILATSREAFNIAGEFAWIVPSLEFPTSDVQSSIVNLQQYDAVRLFVERASAIQSDFKLTKQNAHAIAQICQRVDGIPLAIELAAARVKVLSVEQIAARLDDAMRLLTEGKRSAPPRHQTLRATMDWSYGLLSQPEQSLFRRLSVFAGGFTVEGAENVCVSKDLKWDEVLNVLAHLVDKSLVVKREQNGEARYHMLEPIRQYALQRLGESNETEAIKDRHLNYFLNLAEQAKPELEGRDALLWLDRLEREHDNLRAALGWSQSKQEHGETALRLAAAMSLFWFTRSYLTEGRAWLDGALQNAERAIKRAEIEGTRSKDFSMIHRASFQRSRAWALEGAGNLARAQGDFRSAGSRFHESVSLFREIEDKLGLARALHGLGTVTLRLSDQRSARTLFEESLAIAEEIGSKYGMAAALVWLGNVARAEGDILKARWLYEKSIALLREIDGSGSVITWPFYQLGTLAAMEGDYDRAASLLEESLTKFRAFGETRGVGEALARLGDVRRSQGDYATAQTLYQKGLALNRDLGIKFAIVWCLHGLGQVALHQGDYPRATALFREGLTFNLGQARKENTAMCLAGVAAVLATQNKPGSAVMAARLLGAVAALAVHIVEYDHGVATVRAQLDPETFKHAFAEGRAMTMEQAIAEAEQIIIAPRVAPVAPHDPNALTPRELEVLRLLAQGLGDAQIAEKLIISRRTVNTHLTAIYSKLGVNSRAAATRFALDHRLI